MSTQRTNAHRTLETRLDTESSSISTGSLIVDGGAGIAKKLYIGGDFNGTAAAFTLTGGTTSFTIAVGASNVNLTLAPSGTGRVSLNADPTSALHAVTKQYVDAIVKPIYLSFAVSGTLYINVNSTDLYTAVADILWPGSTVSGTPTICKIIAWQSGAGPNKRIQWRIRDITNALTICESAAVINTTEDIVDMGTISNIPTGVARFQIQARDTNDAGVPTALNRDARLNSLSLYG
jgi:hypothetical protein